MNNIIQHICENYINEVLDFFAAGTIRTLNGKPNQLYRVLRRIRNSGYIV